MIKIFNFLIFLNIYCPTSSKASTGSPLCALRAFMACCLVHLPSFITVSIASFSSPSSLNSSPSGTTSTFGSSFFSVTVFNFSPSFFKLSMAYCVNFFS